MDGRAKPWGWRWWGLAFLLLGVAFYGASRVYWAWPRHGITEHNFNWIQPGMTSRQVKARLGPETKASSWDEPPISPNVTWIGAPPPGTRLYTRGWWQRGRITITVTFVYEGGHDPWGVVVDKHCEGAWDRH